MLERNGGIKDINLNTSNLPQIYKREDVRLTYTKTDKLITALFMVTDTIDKDEPIRLQLRTFGLKILSDIKIVNKNNIKDIENEVSTVLSFMEIAFNIGLISEMNFGILKMEFSLLSDSLKVFTNSFKEKDSWLENFMKDEVKTNIQKIDQKSFNQSVTPVRIGVQKGSTLLQALGGVNRNPIGHITRDESKANFEILKNRRREEIISVIKDRKNLTGMNGSTITDIKNNSKGQLVNCSEKTLQRELVSMVKDGLLRKTGDKRWSQYSII